MCPLANTCSDLDTPHGNVSYDLGTLNSRPVGTTALLTCNKNFALSGENQVSCQSTGAWNGSLACISKLPHN